MKRSKGSALFTNIQGHRQTGFSNIVLRLIRPSQIMRTAYKRQGTFGKRLLYITDPLICSDLEEGEYNANHSKA